MLARRTALIAAFAALFVAYQMPEGVGLRLLGSTAVNGVLMLGFFAVAWAVGRWLLGGGFKAYALERRPGWTRALLFTLVVALGMKGAAVLLGRALGVYRLGPPGASGAAGLAIAGLAALATTFFPSVSEDIVTRGFWLRVLPPAWRDPLRFTLLSSAIFVLNHVYRLGKGPIEWGMLFCFGLPYAAALARSGTLWAAVGLHWGWNLGNALLPLAADVSAAPGPAAAILSEVAHLCELALVLLVPARALGGPPASREPSAG